MKVQSHLNNEIDAAGGETGLREALAYAESIIEAVRQPLLVLDCDLRIRSANSAYREIFKISDTGTEGLSPFLGSGGSHFPQLRLFLERVASGDSAVCDFEIEHDFGQAGAKVILLNARKLPRDVGESGLILLAIEDITERKRTERALAESEKERRFVMDAAPALIAYLTPDLKFRMANSAYERWFGVSSAQVIGTHLSEVYGKTHVESLRPQIDRVLAGETVTFDADYPALNGQKTLQVTYTPDFDDKGNMQGFMVLGNDITERKMTEMALRRSEERLRGLFEAMTEGFFLGELIYDTAGEAVDCRLVEVNRAFEKQTGLSNAIGHTLKELIPGLQEDLIDTYARVVRTGEPAEFEVMVPALKDSWYEVRVRPTFGKSFAVLLFNITDRRKANFLLGEHDKRQAALVALGDRLRELKDVRSLLYSSAEILGNVLKAARVGFGIVDASQEYVLIEGDWTDGKTASLSGRYRFSDFGYDLAGILRRGMPLIVNDVTTHAITARDGERWKALDIEAVVNLPLIENGRLAALLFVQDSEKRVWTDTDLTFLRKVADRTWAAAARANALQELQESEEFTRSVLASSPDCIIVLDLKGRLLTINASGCEQMEIDDSSLYLNRPWADFWGEYKAQVEHILGNAREGEEGRFEGFCPTAKGKPKWWEVIVSPIRDSLGTPIRILSLSRDITERKSGEHERERLTQELKRSNEDLSQFAHTVAHDLQSPLRGITSFAQLLQRNSAGRLIPKDLEFLNHIVDSARRMGELVAALLQFAQLGQGVVPRSPVAMGTVIDEAIKSLTLQIAEQGATVTREEMPNVIGDAVQLIQLMQNLISNALKYRRAEAAPVVAITAAADQERYVFMVKDNGEGIAPEHLKTVFEPLRRLHSTDVPGSGLGLTLCQRIVNRHGGRIWVESECGVGSTFFFTLPIA